MGKSKLRDQNKIIVVGLPTGSSSDDLLKLVRPYGNPLEAAVAVDVEGKPRGFGFVRFGDEEAQQAAIKQLDKTVLQGRTLNVRAVEERGGGDNKARPAGAGKLRPCFDFARGKCLKGAACKWAHVKPDANGEGDGTASRRPEWQKTRAGVALPGSSAESIPEEYCRKYQLGKCHRGAACRWKHEIYRGPTDDASAVRPAASTPTDEALAGRKRPRDAGAALQQEQPEAAQRGGQRGGAQPLQLAIGGGSLVRSDEDRAAEWRAELRRKERQWREVSGEEEAPVPAAVKNKDLLWRATERALARLEATIEA